MTKRDRQLEALRAFGERYAYDMDYQENLMNDAPESFEAFARAQGMSTVHAFLPHEVHWVARVSMMLAEDCGDCLRLNLRMAREAGIAQELLDAVLERPHELSPLLRDVREQAFAVSGSPVGNREVGERLRAALGREGFAELAVCLAGGRLYSSIKRALLKARPAAVALAES